MSSPKLSTKTILLEILLPQWVFLGIPGVVMLFSLPYYFEERAIHESIRIHGGVVTSAEIVKAGPQSHGRVTITYQFTAPTAGGGSQQFTKTETIVIYLPSQTVAVGEPIEIIYSQADPTLSVVKSDYRGQNYTKSILQQMTPPFCILGLCSLPMSLFVFLVKRRSLSKG
jgi:hypothetical protein